MSPKNKYKKILFAAVMFGTIMGPLFPMNGMGQPQVARADFFSFAGFNLDSSLALGKIGGNILTAPLLWCIFLVPILGIPVPIPIPIGRYQTITKVLGTPPRNFDAPYSADKVPQRLYDVFFATQVYREYEMDGSLPPVFAKGIYWPQLTTQSITVLKTFLSNLKPYPCINAFALPPGDGVEFRIGTSCQPWDLPACAERHIQDQLPVGTLGITQSFIDAAGAFDAAGLGVGTLPSFDPSTCPAVCDPAKSGPGYCVPYAGSDLSQCVVPTPTGP